MRLGVRFKVMLGVLVPQTVILGAFAYVEYATHRDVMLETTARTVGEVGRLVEGGLQHAMLTADREAMAATIQELVTRTGIEGLTLLDHQGLVRFAPGTDTVGRVLHTTDRECVPCHGATGPAPSHGATGPAPSHGATGPRPSHGATGPRPSHGATAPAPSHGATGPRPSHGATAPAPSHGATGPRPSLQTAIITQPDGERVLRNCRPIINHAACHACHAPERPYNGVLLTDVSLAQVDDDLERFAHYSLLALAAAVVLSGGAVWVTMDRTVVGPLERLTALARRIAAGALPTAALPTSDDELGELARTLNLTSQAMADRLRLEAQLRERTAELEQLNQALQDKEAARAFLLKRTIHAQEAERKRVARHLHDELAQSLTGLVMGLDAVEPLLATEAVDLRQQLARTRALVVESLEQTRRLILDLRPTMLDDLGLVSALRWYAETQLKAAGAVVGFTIEGRTRRLSPEIETALFRIAQEAVNNVARHARAQRVVIQLTWLPTAVALRIEDDGQGFDPPAVPSYESGAGLGLLGMEERSAIIGGTLTVDSRPGGGTRVVVRLPLPADGDQPRDVPGEEPGDQRKDVPADEPGDQPKDMPGDQPGDQPGEE